MDQYNFKNVIMQKDKSVLQTDVNYQQLFQFIQFELLPSWSQEKHVWI